jgi:murein peptide amidase A
VSRPVQPIAGFALALLGAVAAAQPAAPHPAATPRVERLGESVLGAPVEARVHGSGPDVAMIVASIHGSEPAGTPLVERFERSLAEDAAPLEGRTLVVIPVANPDGYARRVRFNENGVDLNRNFPADNRTEVALHGSGPLSEPESRALMRALNRFAPKRVLSIHQPLRCVDYDGPAEALAKSISLAIDGRLPVQKLGGRPGSLGSYLGETRGVPIVTLELPSGVEADEDALWRDYGAAVGAFLRSPE